MVRLNEIKINLVAGLFVLSIFINNPGLTGDGYDHYNILEDVEFKEGMKKFS